jgi:hypothetical protein
MKTKKINFDVLLEINYVFNTQFKFATGVYNLRQSDLIEIKDLLTGESDLETGNKIWKWFHERWPMFLMYKDDIPTMGKAFNDIKL